MKIGLKKTSKGTIRRVVTGAVFVVMLAIIAFLYPGRIGSSQYRFEEGLPWMYGELCADIDFPILKPQADYRLEVESALKNFAPYFVLDEQVANKQIKLICDSAKAVVSPAELKYLRSSLRMIYDAGIMSSADMDYIEDGGYSIVQIVANRVARETVDSVNTLYTTKRAYESIIKASPDSDMTMLNRFQMNLMLLPNLSYDSAMTAVMKEKTLSELTEYSGMVLKGQKIVDRGEIVTPEIYRQLKSMERNQTEHGVNKKRAIWSFGAMVVIFALFLSLTALYLHVFRQHLFNDLRAIMFFTILMTIIIASACMVARFTTWSIYIVPFAWVPIIVRIFYDSRTAFFLHIVVTLICSFLAPQPFEFVILQMAVGMVIVTSLKDISQRSQLVRTSIWVFLTYALGYTACILISKGGLEFLHWPFYVYFAANALLLIFSYGLIYIFERAFGLVSSITLVELTNINSSLLVEFAEKAPGSFQHSLQVSSLAVDAAKRVGANPLLVRTGALYHDIGKMENPQNFTENQHDGYNPLMEMSYEAAAQAIIAHVENGVAIAERHHLPRIVTKFISMHHGTSKVRYFYNSYKNAHPGEEINEAIFTYPGPRPSSKEIAIMMMADAVEARSRSLTEFTEESIRTMVDQMINAQMADQQFEETPLTFKDIHAIKEVFTKRLVSMNHHRIAYPELRDAVEAKK